MLDSWRVESGSQICGVVASSCSAWHHGFQDYDDGCPTLWIPAFAGMTGAPLCPVDTGSSPA